MPPTTPIIDDFNRADTGPAPSASWTNGVLTFVGGEGLVVLSNQCARKATGGFRQGSYWNVQDFGPNCEVYCTLQPGTLVNNDELSMFLRLTTIGSGTTDSYSVSLANNGTNTIWNINRNDNGVGTQLTTNVTQNISAGDKAHFIAIGTRLELNYLPVSTGIWTTIQSIADATYNVAGKLGFEITNSQNFRFDNFGGGTVVPAIPPISSPITSGLRW